MAAQCPAHMLLIFDYWHLFLNNRLNTYLKALFEN